METLENAQDEKKPLNSLEETQEDEVQPDPDEILKVDTGSGRIWLIKVSCHTTSLRGPLKLSPCNTF